MIALVILVVKHRVQVGDHWMSSALNTCVVSVQLLFVVWLLRGEVQEGPSFLFTPLPKGVDGHACIYSCCLAKNLCQQTYYLPCKPHQTMGATGLAGQISSSSTSLFLQGNISISNDPSQGQQAPQQLCWGLSKPMWWLLKLVPLILGSRSHVLTLIIFC